MKKMILLFTLLFSCLTVADVRLKSLAHISGLQENPLTGYGLVIGLAGSGDSHRNKETIQAITNLLQNFGVNLTQNDINSRNTATVIITANLPANVHQGDKIDLNVASLGDAKSLLGGTLLVTPLKGLDDQIYALAQGPISVGGFKYDLFGNIVQKNHPTAGIISGGGIIEKTIETRLDKNTDNLKVILNHPDFTTAFAIEQAINKHFTPIAKAQSAQEVEVKLDVSNKLHFIRFMSELENLRIKPDNIASIVVNERTGVVIAGAEVKLDAVTISQGNLQIAITTEYEAAELALGAGNDLHSAIVAPNSNISVKETPVNAIKLTQGASIADLMTALAKAHISTRDTIAILESLKRAGALHAELIIE